MPKMGIDEWVAEYSGIPWELYEAAEQATDNAPNELALLAKQYLIARESLLEKLDEVGYEWG